MNFFGNMFPGGSQSKNRTPFEKWSSPPPVTLVPAGRQDVFPLRSLSVGSHFVSASLRPSIVIGLGDTGVLALHQWLEQTAHYENGSFDSVRILSLSASAQRPLPQRWVNVRQISLAEGIVDKNLTPLEMFRQAASIRQFQEWLKSTLLNLRDVQVLIVASAVESEIHLLGPILQILRVFPESTISPYLNVVGLLSLSSAKLGGRISQGESYAALREISRFTFSGLHKTMDLPSRKETVVRSALLDHLFLFDDNLFNSQGDNAFNNGIGQALSESLLFLNHPSSDKFWETLRNDGAGQFRQGHHHSVAHTFGIKTFFIPLIEIQSYLSARLSYAVLFGERVQDVTDQLIPPQSSSSMDQTSMETLARRWLVDHGAGSHPIFEWLWDLQSTSQITIVPDVSVLYNDLYAAKISHKLAEFLNEFGVGDKFKAAAHILRMHTIRFEEILSNLENDQSLRYENFSRMLMHWKKVSDHLEKSIYEWQKIFASSSNENVDTGSTSARLQFGWQKAEQVDDVSRRTLNQTIINLLLESQKSAKKDLEQVVGGKVRFALTHNTQEPLEEIEAYYKDTIRPELTHLGMTVGNGFKWVRNRLSWWIRLESSQVPELLLVCWPSNITIEAGTKPNPEYCYSYGDGQKIVSAIVALASTQINGLTEDMTGAWYTQRLEDAVVVFHDKTEEVFLSYDENIVTTYNNDADKRYYYLVGKNNSATGKFIKSMFPYRLPTEVTELAGNDPTRFTALTTRLNIPFSAIRDINKWYESYNHQSYLHVYSQERLAAVYEDLITRSLGEKKMLSPDFVLTLTDGQLITLFCQALFCRLIRVGNNDVRHMPFWQVCAVEKFLPLNLAAVSSDGLLDAFRAFTLELPNDPDVSLNPTGHFYSERRNDFLNTLHKETRSIRRSDKFNLLQTEFKNGILADWQGRSDLLSRSFAALLQVELDEPVWDDWYS